MVVEAVAALRAEHDRMRAALAKEKAAHDRDVKDGQALIDSTDFALGQTRADLAAARSALAEALGFVRDIQANPENRIIVERRADDAEEVLMRARASSPGGEADGGER